MTFGDNSYGQLGNGSTTSSTIPVQVSGITTGIFIAGGASHTVVLDSDGTIKTFGLNTAGELGDGTTTNSLTPVQMVNISNATSIAAGALHTIVLKSDGSLWAVGNNYFGQLGIGIGLSSLTPFTTPVRVSLTPGQKVYRVFDAIQGNIVCIHEDNLVRTNRGTIPIKDVFENDIVYDEKNNEVRVKYNIKVLVARKQFVKIAKGSLIENSPKISPENDLYIVPGHPIKYNDEEVSCEKLVGKVVGVTKCTLSEPHFVYCLCTDERTFVNIENVFVCTRTEESWNELTKKFRILWKKQ
jgi:hypothetical protein